MILTAVKEHLGYAGNGIKHFFKNENQMWLSFLLPALIMLASYFIFGVWPFGEKSVLGLDMNAQYVYYHNYMFDAIYGGESIFYSWSRNLSGEWMGIIGYYLGSPFNWIVWLLPREWIIESLLAMICIKVGSIGLAMSVYLSRGKGFKKLTVIIFSICYALCAFTICQTVNPMWLDGVLALPLICLGLERFVDQGRFRLLVAAWVYAFVTCFYIGYMLAIFSVIYFFFYIFTTKEAQARKRFFQKLLGALGLGVTAVLISCFMLIPVYISLSYGKFEFSEPDYTYAANFPIIDTLDKIMPNSYDSMFNVTGLPFLYCGVITVLLLPAYFLHDKIRRSERIGYAALLLILLISMYIRPIDMLWHGGQATNGMPYRYSFIVSFLMAVCAASVFDRLKEVSTKCLGITCAGLLAIAVHQENAENFVETVNSGEYTVISFSPILPELIIVFVMAMILVQLRKGFNFQLRKNMSKVLSIVLLVAVCGEAMYNTVGQLQNQADEIGYATRSNYFDIIDPIRDTVKEIKEKDDGFYRIEDVFVRMENDPLGIGAYGLSHSSSMMNAKATDLLGRLGFAARSNYTRYNGATLISSSLLGVKYELSTPNNYISEIEKSNTPITVTENEYALPVSYIADNAIQEQHLTKNDPFVAQTQLLNALIGEEYPYYERIYDYDMKLTNLTQSVTDDMHFNFTVADPAETSSITYTFDMPKTSHLLVYFPTDVRYRVSLTLNGEDKGQYFGVYTSCIRDFGEFPKGEHITLVLTPLDEEVYFREAQFAVMDEELIKEALTELLDMNSDTRCYLDGSTTHVVTEVNCDADRTLFTTIPDEQGWTVYVDGKKTNYKVAVDSLIAIPLDAGYHKVEMRFTTAGYPAAIILSIAGVLIFAGIIVFWLMLNPGDREKRKAHLMRIYSGEAYRALKDRDESDRLERKRLKKEKDKLGGVNGEEQQTDENGGTE